MKKNLLTLLGFVMLTPLLMAQNTVGLLSYEPSQAFDGFNLMFPHNQPNVYLLDNCGEVVNVWEDEANFRPGNIAYLRPDGTLVKGKRDAAVGTDPIWAGGGGAIIEIRDWDNNLMWSYELNDENDRLHHDFAPMDNGNILAIAWELKTEEEAMQAGRDTSTTAQDKLWPDYIIEIDPSTDEIVWEWHVWDHLIQDFDETKDNFGVVADHPELIDINYDTNDGHPDWLHGNSLDFNEELNQIMISIPYFDEIWVIDHSTTTEQAASHNGGLSGKGGDLMYRWGNPAAYQQGTEEDKTLFFQHDAHWVDDFVDFTHPHFNKIAVFNNRVGEDFSQANVFNPPWDMYSWEYTLDGETYGPTDYDLTLQHPEDPTNLFSTGLSSVQFLPNGNSLITSGRFGYTFELTPDNEIVWEYKTPINGGASATQGDTLAINNNLTFRMKRYPADFEAFEGRDMTGKSWIELEPDTEFCDLILPVGETMADYYLKVYPNPASNQVTIEWEGGLYADVMIYDMLGRKIDSFRASGGRKYLDISGYEAGIYFIEIEGRQTRKFVVQE